MGDIDTTEWPEVEGLSIEEIRYCKSSMRPEMLKDAQHLKKMEARCTLDMSEWQDFVPKNIPQVQPSRVQDSGVFALLFAYYVAMGIPFDFTKDHCQMVRERLTAKLLIEAKT